MGSLLRADTLVLGAGIVGVATALHLQAQGRNVMLLDRHTQAGRETSFGNAGLIERSSVLPYMFPRDVRSILRVALGRSSDARYHLAALPHILPWLARYFRASSQQGIARSAAAALPLIERCVAAHDELMRAANAQHLARRTGWLKLFRTTGAFAAAQRGVAALADYGLNIAVCTPGEVARLEPHLAEMAGAVHYRDPVSIVDPGALSLAYMDLFVARGGRFLTGDAMTLEQTGNDWKVLTSHGPCQAREAVVTLGPWAGYLLRSLGYRLPLEIKRGYHMHFGAKGNAVLNHPVLDVERGYLLAPMQRGIRLTTGAEFARFDAPPTPVQVDKAEPVARSLFPLAERLDAQPWMGRRPCLPDMLPVLGRAPGHQGLWLNFGHQHHGLTLGPVTGQLLAQMMAGEETLCDPAPYRLERFS